MLRPLTSRRAIASTLATARCSRLRSFSTAYQSARPLVACSQWQPRTRNPTLQAPQLNPLQRRHYAEQMIKVPEMAESISEGTLKQFSKGVGDYVERDEEIATIETDKIDVAVNAPDSGTIKEILVNEEDTVTVGQEIAKMETGTSPREGGGGGASKPKQEQQPKQEAEKPKEEPKPEPKQETKQEPKQEQKREQSSLQKEENAAQQQQQQQAPPSPPPPQRQERQQPQQPQSKPQPSPPKQEQKKESGKEQTTKSKGGEREERRVKMNRMRLRIAERLKQSQNTAASLTTFQKVDMSSIMDFRKAYKDEILKKTGTKLGFMGPFARASILAMKDVPTVNASIEGPGGGDTIVYRDYVDISVAVATEKGLVTPVVRNAEALDMVGIEGEIAALGKKARDNKLTIEDMAGGTFTISNGGVFGSLFGTPIINLPQTAVLGLHAINEEAVPINGKIEIRPIMYLALTYDHRLLDGREAVTFLVKVKQYIEDPRRMLVG